MCLAMQRKIDAMLRLWCAQCVRDPSLFRHKVQNGIFAAEYKVINRILAVSGGRTAGRVAGAADGLSARSRASCAA